MADQRKAIGMGLRMHMCREFNIIKDIKNKMSKELQQDRIENPYYQLRGRIFSCRVVVFELA